MSSNETRMRRLRRIIIKANLNSDDYLVYTIDPRRFKFYKLTVAEWRKEGDVGQAFDRLMLSIQMLLGTFEVAIIPGIVSLLFSKMSYKWFFLLLLAFCAYFGPKQLLYGIASVRWLIRHRKKIPPEKLLGGW